MIARTLVALAVSVLAGCALLGGAGSIATGTASADVRARLGAPTDVRTVAGARVWDYVQGPQGFTTWRLTFDANERVSRVEQILTDRRILALESGKHTREDVANLLGRPAETMRFGANGAEVWTYRFVDYAERRLGDVYFDARTGAVSGVSTYPDPAYINGMDS